MFKGRICSIYSCSLPMLNKIIKMRSILNIIFFLIFISSCKSNQDSIGREVTDFTQDWSFSLNTDSLAQQLSYDDSSWRKLNLPHDWSIESDFSDKYPSTAGGGALPGGKAWYRKTFIPNDINGRDIYIEFDGIYWNSKVYINGHLLGHRPNGYVSFRYDLTPYIKEGEKNVIAVSVDNSAQPNSRWYTGSGIYRNVRLIKMNPIHLAQWSTFVHVKEITDNQAKLTIDSKLRSNLNNNAGLEVLYEIIDKDNKVIYKTSQRILSKNDSILKKEVLLEKPKLWSIDNPYLYTLSTKVKQGNKILDEERVPFGIRTFYFDHDNGFFLNGENIKIKGVCMHHDLGLLGAAVNKRAMQRQLEILKDMGCNGIRTSHNAADPQFLNLCDEMGFIVMEDVFDMWAKKKSPHDYAKYFPEWHRKDLEDVVLRDRNHPSIFMWNIGNEVLEQWADINTDTLSLQQANMMFNFASKISKQSKEDDELHVNSLLTMNLVNIVKQIDSTRVILTGNNEAGPQNLLFKSESMDLLGFNYNDKVIKDLPSMYPNKKYILTESTSSTMSRGFYESPSDKMFIRPERWDKPYDQPIRQCSSYDNSFVPWGTTHEKTWDLVKNNDFLSGLYIWTGFDYLGEPTPYWWPARSSYFGIVDLAGFPKDVYYMYQSEWTDKNVLHVFPHWNWKKGDLVDVWAYYNNADEVELFINDKSFGKREKLDNQYHVVWRVPFESGTLKAISYAGGKPVMISEVKTADEPVSLRLTADRNTILADSKDLSFITIEALDKNGNLVPLANNLISFSIKGEGSIVGTDNGDPTDHNSLRKHERHLFNGKALVVVQSKSNIGDISVTATSQGLNSASIKINTK